MNKGLKALDEFRLLINNYEEKWDANTTSFFRSCHDAIKDALEDYYEIKEISENYHFNDLGHDVFKVETDRKWQLKFDAGICDVQEDYKKARAFELIKEGGCSLEHILLIEKTKNYEEYDAQFDKYLEIKYEPFKFEVRKSKEEYNLLKKALS